MKLHFTQITWKRKACSVKSVETHRYSPVGYKLGTGTEST